MRSTPGHIAVGDLAAPITKSELGDVALCPLCNGRRPVLLEVRRSVGAPPHAAEVPVAAMAPLDGQVRARRVPRRFVALALRR